MFAADRPSIRLRGTLERGAGWRGQGGAGPREAALGWRRFSEPCFALARLTVCN